MQPPAAGGVPVEGDLPLAAVPPVAVPPAAEEPRALGADVLISVACLLSVLVCLLALAIALEALLLRMLNLDGSTSTAEAGTPERQPRLQRHQQQVHREVKSSRGQQERALLPSLPTGAYQSSRKMFCVFNWALEGNDSVRPGYGLAFFPHQLCTDAVLCCAGLEPTTLALQADTIQTLRFSALRLSNAWLRLWLCLGGDEARSRGFADAADDTDARRRLVRSSVDWLQESGFQGVLMHWAPPGPRHPRQLVRILAPFKVALDLTGQSLGAVLPLDEAQRARFDSAAVADLLERHSVLVWPHGSDTWLYNRTFLPYSLEVVEQYARAADELSHDACYLVSLSGASLALEDRDQWELGDPALGPTALVAGNQPGLVALDEVCVLQWLGSKVRRYGTFSRRGSQWAGYLTAGTLRDLLSDLGNATGSRGAIACLGVVDPEWDDFSGRCQPGFRFPLTRVVAAAALGIKALAEYTGVLPVPLSTTEARTTTGTEAPSYPLDGPLLGA